MTTAADPLLAALVGLSQRLGEPARDLVILGDGNTSARIDADTFWVKASGAALHGIGPDGFTAVRFAPILALLAAPPTGDADLKSLLAAARVDPAGRHPSIETIFHALALTECGAQFAAHTHPIAINGILCARGARTALQGHLFSESALYLGAAPIIIDYADPGLPLALTLRAAIRDHLERWGQPPRIFYLLNHGMVALGQTPQEVENITAMAVKAARILGLTAAFGGPQFLADADVARILVRPDEAYRRQLANQGEA